LKARLGGSAGSIEPLQRVAPPCQADRSERRLGRRAHDVGERRFQIEQGVEGGS
jgi:hypothetical protein